MLLMAGCLLGSCDDNDNDDDDDDPQQPNRYEVKYEVNDFGALTNYADVEITYSDASGAAQVVTVTGEELPWKMELKNIVPPKTMSLSYKLIKKDPFPTIIDATTYTVKKDYSYSYTETNNGGPSGGNSLSSSQTIGGDKLLEYIDSYTTTPTSIASFTLSE